MNEVNKKNKTLIIISVVFIVLLLCVGGYYMFKVFFNNRSEEDSDVSVDEVAEMTDYNINLIREINKNEKGNYLISPYSIEIAFSMLRDGADGKTREEIENVIGNREINYLNVKNKINVANALFVNNKAKNNVLDSYYKTVKDKYNSEIIYDDLETPKVVNDWVNKETNKMIPKLFERFTERPLLVLANALAIDVEWRQGFDCKNTSKKEFAKQDGSKYDVAMMRQSYEENVKYFETDNASGVIIPYQSYDDNGNKVKIGGNNLEFIGILPNIDVKKYVDTLTVDEISKFDENSKLASEDVKVFVSLPRFSYDYTVPKFIDRLKNLGIEEVFNPTADLSKMVNTSSNVGEAVHKTHIEVDEKGTKAAAATGKGVTKNGASTVYSVTFDKPFAYIIRDQKTKEMLFFGVVYKPNKWSEKNKCK